jgi:hypothetical protein
LQAGGEIGGVAQRQLFVPAPAPHPFCSRFLKNDGMTAYKR